MEAVSSLLPLAIVSALLLLLRPATGVNLAAAQAICDKMRPDTELCMSVVQSPAAVASFDGGVTDARSVLDAAVMATQEEIESARAATKRVIMGGAISDRSFGLLRTCVKHWYAAEALLGEALTGLARDKESTVTDSLESVVHIVQSCQDGFDHYNLRSDVPEGAQERLQNLAVLDLNLAVLAYPSSKSIRI